MSNPKPQSFSNHARLDPPYHIFTTLALLANLVIGVILLVVSLHTQLLLGIWIVIRDVRPAVSFGDIKIDEQLRD